MSASEETKEAPKQAPLQPPKPVPKPNNDVYRARLTSIENEIRQINDKMVCTDFILYIRTELVYSYDINTITCVV